MKALTEQALVVVSGGGFGKDESVHAAIELTKFYYERNPELVPSVEDIFNTIVEFYDDFRDKF